MTPSPRDPTVSHRESWREYWSRDLLWRDSRLGGISAGIFLRRAPEFLPFGRRDAILEIGCGPGHLAALLAPVVERVHAVDVAPQFVELCRQRCRDFGNVTVGLLGSDYTDLAGCGGPFTRIICVSVIQYYRDLAEVERLIRSARAVAAPGAALLIADFPLARGSVGFVWDAFCTLARALRGGYLGPVLRAAGGRWRADSPYRLLQDRLGSLVFTRAALGELVLRMGLNATVLRRSLSIYANRPSLLVGF